MVEWLAGNRIRGTTAERPNLGLIQVVVLVVGKN